MIEINKPHATFTYGVTETTDTPPRNAIISQANVCLSLADFHHLLMMCERYTTCLANDGFDVDELDNDVREIVKRAQTITLTP